MKSNPVKKSLLFISIDFPPARTSGIYRPVFFAKYLIENGWDITLLTASEHLSTVEDSSLSDHIHPALNVVRTHAPMPRKLTGKLYDRYLAAASTKGRDTSPGVGPARSSVKARLFSLLKKCLLSPIFRLIDNFILIPDNYILWSIKNIFRARRIIKKRGITHLLVTSPPHSVQVLGLILRFLTGVRYVTDFRNSWTDNQPYRYRLRERFEKFVERKALDRSRAIINMSPGDVDRLLARLPDIPRDKLFVIHNAYNESDFTGYAVPEQFDPAGPLKLVYVGSMYPHSGDTTAEALRILHGKGYTPNDLRLAVIGFSDPSFTRLVDDYGIGHFVENMGFMSHDRLMRAYPEYDILYLLTGGTAYYHIGALPGKIFEYMRLGKPILHAGIDGTTHRMLIESNLETFVPLDNPDGIAEAVIDFIKRKKASAPMPRPNWDYIRTFEWKEHAEQVHRILSAIE